MNPRRLYRCRQDRQIAGVAAGMAEYLEVDPTIVRVLWILSIFVGGVSILLYIVLAFVIPLEPWTAPVAGFGSAAPAPEGEAPTAGVPPTEPGSTPAADGAAIAPVGTGIPGWSSAHAGRRHETRPDGRRGGRVSLVVGVMLVAFGVIALANSLIPGWALTVALGPAILVALGVALMVGAARRPAPGQ